MTWPDLVPTDWRGYLEICALWFVIYYAWLSIRGTRGARVLVGLAVLVLSMATTAGFFELPVLGWIIRNVMPILIFAVIVIFQPEVRRGLAALGSNRWFSTATGTPETIELITEATFDLSNRQLGALLAIERDQNLDSIAENGQAIDCTFSPALVVSIFFPKTPLHDGGLVIRNNRVVVAACTFPVSQRVDLDRTLGMRHRAALGLSEESDAIVIVVSEETGIVSICHRGSVERNFDPESFKRRLSELLSIVKNEKTVASHHPSLAGETRFSGSGIR
ncbi:MAG: diadenylate cyclase CdaA, partial [Chthoniobacteraceae bacterium]